MAEPRSQKARPIKFVLKNEKRTLSEHTLIIRPEEFSLNNPSRLTVTQTLDGAWADSFGPGIPKIILNGHTGWRGNDNIDGAAIFEELKKTIFDRWHEARAGYIFLNRDPNLIELIYSDFLNEYSAVVVPNHFHLKRHRTKPLLMSYNIDMEVMNPLGKPVKKKKKEPVGEAIAQPLNRFEKAQEVLSSIIEKIDKFIEELKDFFSPVTDFLADVAEFANDAIAFVNEVIDDVTGVIGSVLSPILAVVSTVQSVISTGFQLMAKVGRFTNRITNTVSGLASAFNTVACTLRNGFGLESFFPDFESLFGSSTCSSTGGGRAISEFNISNPMSQIFDGGRGEKSKAPSVTIDNDASSSIEYFQMDPLTNTDIETGIMGQMANVRNGVVFSKAA